jgi:hypothetical protein
VLRGGAVAFTQYFGSALQLTPHLHVLVPEGLWAGEAFVPLPPPDGKEVEGVLARVVRQLGKDFEALEEAWPEDALDALWTEGLQHRVPLTLVESPARHGRLAAHLGFRLHADTAVHAHDRHGLVRLCRYGSRGPLALERLSLRDDGRYAYRTKRGFTLVLTAAQLVKRLVALVPPRGRHLTSFHGVFASHATLRPRVTLPDEAEVPPRVAAPSSPARLAGKRPRNVRPRLDWATLQKRTFGVDLWTCTCGGKRKVLALVTSRRTALEVLASMGLDAAQGATPPPATAQGPPQLTLAL